MARAIVAAKAGIDVDNYGVPIVSQLVFLAVIIGDWTVCLMVLRGLVETESRRSRKYMSFHLPEYSRVF